MAHTNSKPGSIAFRWLLTGQAISAVGSQVTFMALPLIAVTLLHADPMMMGILAALDNLPYLLFGLFVGSLVDRHRRRPLMIGADLLRTIAVATIPVVFLLGNLSIGQLCVVAFVVGIGNIVFDVACQAQLPELVEGGDLVQANGALQTTTGVASLMGPGLVGVFIKTVGAPIAMLVDAISYLLSALCIRRTDAVTKPERIEHVDTDATVWSDVRVGVGTVVRDPNLLGLVGAGAAVSLGMNAGFPVMFVLFDRSMGLDAIAIGLVFLTIALCGATGALTANWVAKAIGAGRLLSVGPVVGGAGLAVMACGHWFTPHILFVYVGAALTGWGVMASQALTAGMRQALAPERIRGRVLGAMRFVEWGVMPLGSLVGGLLGAWIGVAPALGVAGLLVATGCIWVIANKLSRMREVPAA